MTGPARVVDVDTHWESVAFGPGEHPLEPWLDRLPDRVEMLAFGIAGDLLRALPADRRPDGRTLMPALVRMAEERGGPIILHPQHDSTAAERVAWMDRVGIDHCLVNPGGYWQMLEFIPDARAEGVRRCNDYLGERLAGSGGRLHGVAVVDLRDLDAAATELARARARGHRATSRPVTRRGTSCGAPRSTSAWSRSSTSATRRPTSAAGPTSAGTFPVVAASPR
jgi:hypothetical protein